MTPERWQQVKGVLENVLEVAPDQRDAFLDRACGGDQALRQEVESLLATDDELVPEKRFNSKLLSEATLAVSEAASFPHEADPWIGRLVGPYKIVEQIGVGGMGEVYRAVRDDEQYRRQVAIKVVRAGQDSALVVSRFRNERQILASLDHPNIARLLDGGTTKEGAAYFVMELIEGEPVDQYCNHYKLAVNGRLKLFLQVCSAVQYAHQRLIIHRDIKPGNILVTSEGVPKLLDFGIAKLLDTNVEVGQPEPTVTMFRVLTPAYASPEQVKGEPITTASDVYSLGVVLYELLTGSSPYQGTSHTPHEMVRAVCEIEPEAPSTALQRIVKESKQGAAPKKASADSPQDGSLQKLRKRLSGDLDNIVLMALRKEPQRRYVSVDQFAEDIRRHLEGLPITASKGSWGYRAGKFLRRHRAGVLAAGLALIALLIGVGLIVREARIARSERQRADQRFNDVRHLANTLIFEMDDAIASLPGSTPARKLLVDNALRYLDTLAKEAKGDLTLQRELAGAYQKLGDVQGNPYRGNLGDTGAALESYRKALAIRQALAAANPENRDDQLALAVGYDWLAAFTLATSGNPQEGLANATKALTIMEPLAKANPTNFDIAAELQSVYGEIGDIQAGTGSSANLGDIDSALENHRKALAIAERVLHDKPDDTRTLVKESLFHAKIAEDLVKQGDRVAALEDYRKALDILQSLAIGSVSTIYSRYISLFYQRIGNAQMIDGDSRAALKSYRTALDISEKLAAADPQNALARGDLALDYSFVGKAAADSGNEREGLAFLQKAIDLLEKEVAHDPKTSQSRRYLGFSYLLRGEVLLASGKLDGALTDYKKTAAILESITSNDAKDVEARIALAATSGKIADILAMQGESSVASEMYQKVLTVVEPFAHSGRPVMQAQYTAADTYSGLGAVLQKQGSKKGLTVARQIEYLSQARSWFERSLAEWRQVRSPGKFGPSGFDTAGPSRVTEKLSLCDATLKELKERAEVARRLGTSTAQP